MDLIPGLPDDLARQCLMRLPFKYFPSLLSVCKAWNFDIRNHDFNRIRRLTGHARPVFILADVSPRYRQNTRPNELSAKLFYGLVIFDPESGPGSGTFTYLPPTPPLRDDEFSGFIISGIVGVGFNIVVILFATKRGQKVEFVNLVHVFDLLTGQWRRGADLPGPGQSKPGVAGDPNRRQVLVAGGYNHGGEGLKSAFLYDVAADTWIKLDDMKKGRFECNIVFQGGQFHVISGRRNSPRQPFTRMTCVESLDLKTLLWGPIKNDFLEASTSEYHWVMENGDGDMYQLGQDVTTRSCGTFRWHGVTEVPTQLREHITWAMTWRDRMVVIGKHPKAYILNLTTYEWTQYDLPYESCYVGCGMDL